jgi:hypothetical protein
MKRIIILLCVSIAPFIKTLAQTEWAAGNPPFREYSVKGLWVESFVLDSVTVIKDTTKRNLIKAPNDLGTIDKAIASYVSFNTKAWGKSLYKIDYFKEMDYPPISVVEQMSSEDHKKNGYYKHYLTLHLTYDTTEIAACFVETYYNQKETNVHYLLMFERRGNTWYLLGGNPYQYLKSLSEIKFQYAINLMQGIKMNLADPNAVAYNQLLAKIYKNNIMDLNVLNNEVVPNIFDNDSIKNYKSQYAGLLASPNYVIDWNLISSKSIQVKSFYSSQVLFSTYFKNMKPENDKRFILDESKLDFSTEESALASLYSTQSKATFDLHSINCTYDSYWPKRVRELDTLNSQINLRHKFSFSFNSVHYTIVGYQLIINGSGLQFLSARFIRKWDKSTSKFSYLKDETRENYKLDEITWMIGCMDEGFLKRLCGVDPVTDPAEQLLINSLKTDNVLDFSKIITEWYTIGSPLKMRLKRPR